MITIESDQPALGAALKSLVDQVVRCGGWIHQDLVIISESGSVRVESRLPEGRDDLLVSLPEEALLPVGEVTLGLRGDEITIECFSEQASHERRNLFETMVGIYNLCGKIRAHRTTAPRFVFEEKSEIARLLKAGRESTREDNPRGDKALLVDFLHSRMLAFDPGSPTGSREVLMPVIDFFNHHPDAPAFQTGTSRHPGQPALGVKHWKCGQDSHQCFVRYSHFDAFDLFNSYGYLERGCRFVRSVPLALDLESLGLVRVRSEGCAFFRRRLPAQLLDLRKWMPVAEKTGPNELELSHLVIPTGTDRNALRRVLATMISSWKPGLDRNQLDGHVAKAERSVLETNIRYYENLRRCLEQRAASNLSTPMDTAATEMAKSQLGLLRIYEFRD